MIKGIFTSAAAMRAGIAKQDVTANNLANANTAGFKRDRMFVEDMIAATSESPQTSLMNSIKSSRFTEFTSGAFDPTSAPLDFAIQGRGFFVLQSEDGESYTRNGHFLRNNEGLLVDATGRKVLGEGGEIALPNGTITVSVDGAISVDGQRVDKLRVMDFQNPQSLNKEEGGAFSDRDQTAGAEIVERPTVVQGFLETSNVETMQEMVQMIATARNYEVNARLLTTQDESLRHVVNEIGRV